MPTSCTDAGRDTETRDLFWATLLQNRLAWAAGWAAEQRMSVELPDLGGTDGVALADRAAHSLVLNMITRYTIYPAQFSPRCNMLLPRT